MKKKAIDLSDVEMNPVRESENGLEVEVTSKHGVAKLTIDCFRDEYVSLEAVLPSGNVYRTKTDSWAGDTVDLDTDEGVASILRLSAALVVQCFEKELQKRN